MYHGKGVNMLDQNTQQVLNHAMSIAESFKHELVSIEHILLSLTQNQVAVDILSSCNIDIDKLKLETTQFLDSHKAELGHVDHLTRKPEPTVAFHRLVQRAAAQVQNAGKKEVTLGHLLISLLEEKQSYALYLLEKQGLKRYDLVNFVSHGTPNSHSIQIEIHTPGQQGHQNAQIPAGQPPAKTRSAIELYTEDYIQKARDGKFDPLIGRDKVLARSLQILSRRNKNNPILVGEPGVGKTAIAQGLAQLIAAGDVPTSLKKAELYCLDMGGLIAGTKFRGEFEERLKKLLGEIKQKEKAILFIDEIHTIIGAGSTQGGSMDASNLLKPALANGELSCIGSTTYKEFKNHFSKDQALLRRFQKVDILAPSLSDSVAILEGLKSKYEDFHKVSYSKPVIKAAVELSAKHLHDRQLPDKAIDVIDEAGAYLNQKSSTKKSKNVQLKDIEHIISTMTQLPPKTVSSSENEKLKSLEEDLKQTIFGQDTAIEQLVLNIKMARLGIGKEDKPIGSFLFAGPTGVGKTELTKQLAKNLGVKFLRFDMSEYMEKHSVSRLVGAPPGYVGFDEGGLLTDTVTKHPYSVLLFDEIEKAHPDLINILLQVMDNGQLTDSNGKVAHFENCIIVMTSNAGAQAAARGVMGIGQVQTSTLSIKAIKKHFKPEFINRLDAIVEFKALEKPQLLNVINKFVGNLKSQLLKKKINLHLDTNVTEWLFNKGYKPEYGARPFERIINEEIKKPLVDEILFGPLQKGGDVFVKLIGNQLLFDTNKLLTSKPDKKLLGNNKKDTKFLPKKKEPV